MYEFKSFNKDRNLNYNSNYVLDFSSNDYLCLSNCTDAISFAYEFALKFGAGSKGSRLITNNFYLKDLEELLCLKKNKEACLVFPSGWQANVSVVNCLINNLTDDVDVFVDQLCHNSIYFGLNCNFALKKVNKTRFQNNNLEKLEDLLQSSKAKNKIVLTESLFSMDGTILDVEKIVFLKKKYGFFLFIDEAHAFGIFGNNLMGLTEGYEKDIDLISGTFSKSIGCQGGFVLTSNFIRDIIINKSSGFIYSTGISPFLIGFIYFILKEKIITLKEKISNMLLLANDTRNKIIKKDYKTKGSSQIVPIFCNSQERLIQLNDLFLSNNIKIPLIKSPTVPLNEERFRLTLNINHTNYDLDKLISLL